MTCAPAPACLVAFWIASRTQKKTASSTGGAWRPTASATTRTCIGARRGERAERLVEAVVAQLRRVDAVPERAQLLDRRLGVVDDLVEPGRDGAAPAWSRASAELDLDRDEPVLGAVVEVALQPQPLARTRLDDPRT